MSSHIVDIKGLVGQNVF